MVRKETRLCNLGILTLLLFTSAPVCNGFRQPGFTNRPPNDELGCFKDSSRSPDLALAVSRGAKAMTKKLCKKLCKDSWHKYAAVQNGDTCWCGNSFGIYGGVDRSECNQIPCTGEENESCGGPLRNLIMDSGYSLGHTMKVNKCWLVANLNCPIAKFQGALKSRKQCRILCGAYRNKFAAVEGDNRCFCGDVFFGHTVMESQKCNEPCSGNPSEACGGFYNNMFIMYSELDENDHGLLLVEGCYVDVLKPLLSAISISLNSGTNQSSYGTNDTTGTVKFTRVCQEKCKESGFKLAGVAHAFECWCSNTFNSKAMLTDEQKCNKPCTENPDQMCVPNHYIVVKDSGLQGHTPIVKKFNDRTHGRDTCG